DDPYPHGSVANLRRPVNFSVRASKVRISRPAGVSTVTTTRSAEAAVAAMRRPFGKDAGDSLSGVDTPPPRYSREPIVNRMAAIARAVVAPAITIIKRTRRASNAAASASISGTAASVVLSVMRHHSHEAACRRKSWNASLGTQVLERKSWQGRFR